MKIEVTEDETGYAPKHCRFTAIDADTYDGAYDSRNRSSIGYGATPDEAIADLKEILEDDMNNCAEGVPESVRHALELRNVSHERLQEIAAECWSWELVIALMSALAGAPHWRSEAQELLRKISQGTLPEPRA